jgi:peptidoglycan/xylan/chitin deacetylase (PgdA/CDA1 family)
MVAFPILMYGSVPASGPGDPTAIPLDLVDRQWRALRAEGWTLTGLTDALMHARGYPNLRVAAVTFDEGYANFVNVPELLEKHQAQATLYLGTANLGEAWQPGQRWLSWPEVAALPDDLVELGCNAHHHRPLDVLPPAEVEDEVQRSRSLITDRLGIKPVSFCYPNGYLSSSVIDVVSATDYENACIIGRRLADPYGNPLALPRLQIRPAHDEVGILKLVAKGEAGPIPKLKRAAFPYWRAVRKGIYRTTGVMLT